MDKYLLVKKLGKGATSEVWKAINWYTKEYVAIKSISSNKVNIDEVNCLRLLQGHPYIIKLLDIVQGDNLNLVFECMESNLLKITGERTKPLPERQCRMFMFQILQALEFIHGRGCCHRDIKPSNILVTNGSIKIADFGLAINMTDNEKRGKPLNTYVVTRWYRAPELLFDSPSYDYSIDMWALGAVMAEFYNLSPIFRGDNEIDQINKICSVIGCPTKETWAYGLDVASENGFEFPKECNGINTAQNLRSLLPTACPEAIDLMTRLLSWDTKGRPTAREALYHPFFRDFHVTPSYCDRFLALKLDQANPCNACSSARGKAVVCRGPRFHNVRFNPGASRKPSCGIPL